MMKTANENIKKKFIEGLLIKVESALPRHTDKILMNTKSKMCGTYNFDL